MLRWPLQATRFSFILHRSLRPSLRGQPQYHQQRFATTSSEVKRTWFEETFPILNQLGIPSPNSLRRGSPAPWMRHVEQALPAHLRHGSSNPKGTVCLNPVDAAGILLAGHKLVAVNEHPGVLSILAYLGIVEQRWDAVIWLVKHVIEGTNAVVPPSGSPSFTISPWTNEGSMRSITNQAFKIASPGVSDLPSLDNITSSQEANEAPDRAIIRKDFIGMLWFSLAEMILACEDGVIKPEILEIIAYLHHRELMPMSIYSQKPPVTTTAIQQPPLLHLLSSKILKSLSDAAWKAQERHIMREAEARGSYYRAIPASAYRVHVEGLRPEVWLELVLWSCLQGDWLSDGLAILYRICVHRGAWAPLPWRSLMLAGQESHDTVHRFFDMSQNSTTDVTDRGYAQIRRTISNEVVNAYIDALLSAIPETEPQSDTLVALHAPRLLAAFKMFMERSNSELSAGSWDTVVLRGHDSTNAILAGSALALPSTFAENMTSSPQLSHLVPSGSFIAVGLYHNALRQLVEQGNLEGSVEMLKQLNAYTTPSTTRNREASAVDLGSQHRAKDLLCTSHDQVGANPETHEAEIPTTILAPLLDLIMDSQAYNTGRALLDQNTRHMYAITREMYGDPVLSASLVRFAAETGDRILFSKIVSASTMQKQSGNAEVAQLPEHLSRAFLDTQINLRKWSVAKKLLEFMEDLKYMVDADNLANLGKIMLKAQAKRKEGDLEQAKDMFSMMLAERADRTHHKALHSRLHYKPQHTADEQKDHGQKSLVVTMIASLDPYWAGFCTSRRKLSGFHKSLLRARTFNLVFEGILEAFGSSVGRRLLQQFWPRSLYGLHLPSGVAESTTVVDRSLSTSKARRNLRLLRSKRTILLPGQSDKVVIYGGYTPNMMTFDLLFRQLLKEMSLRPKSAGKVQSPKATVGDVEVMDDAGDTTRTDAVAEYSDAATLLWVVRNLRLAGSSDESIRRQLLSSLQERDMREVRELLPYLFVTDDIETFDDAKTS